MHAQNGTEMKELEGLLRDILREEHAWSGAPGAMMAVVHGAETAFVTEGFRDREKRLPVTPETLYVIASCSKSMTTAMLGRLVDEGVLGWDAPVTEYAPDLVLKDPAAAGMTLRDMLLHRTGLADHDGLWPDPEGRAALAKRLRYVDANLAFREKRQYNNVIYALTAYVAECATGKTYDDLMRETIFRPLGMERTFTRHADFLTDADSAEPYYYKNGTVLRQARWNMDPAVAAAAIATDAVDAAKWLRFNISKGFGPDGTRLLSEDSWNQIHHGGIECVEDPRKDFMSFSGYGFGWWEGVYRGHRVYKHTGKINGFSSLEIFMPDAGAGCFTAVDLHCPADHLYYRASYTAFDYLLGIRDGGREWARVYRTDAPISPKESGVCDYDYMPARALPPAPPAFPAAAYAGEYRNDGYGSLRITEKDGTLRWERLIYSGTLDPWDGETFRAEEFWEDVKNITMPFTFAAGPGETRPSAVTLPVEATTAPVTFLRIG